MTDDDRDPPARTLADALAELEAAKARVERDARATADAMRADLVTKLLPLLDDLDRTIAAARHDRAVADGIVLVRAQLEGVLRGYGVERVDASGAAFDPALHDAVATVAVRVPDEHHQVVEQIAPGYRFAGKLLRPARVVVGKYAAPIASPPVGAIRIVRD